MNLYEQLCSDNLLWQCWKEISSGKKEEILKASRGIDNISLLDFKESELDNINKILSSLKSNSYHMSPLKGIKKVKPHKDKDRLLSTPIIHDRLVHRALLKIITPIINPQINTGISYCGGFKDKGIKKSPQKAILHFGDLLKEKNYWVFETDIVSFFDNVHKEVILKKILNLLPDQSLKVLLEEIIYFEIGNLEMFRNDQRITLSQPGKSISQGSPLSPLFSNIYLRNFDLEMKKICNNQILRYVDDFIIVTDTEKNAKLLGEKSGILLQNEDLTISPWGEKTHIKDMRGQAIEFLGLKINRHKITTKKSSAEINQKLTQEDLNFNTYKKTNHHYSTAEIIKTMNNKLQGWANYFKSYHVEDKFESANRTINMLKIKNSRLQKISNIDLKIVNHIIPLDAWKSFF